MAAARADGARVTPVPLPAAIAAVRSSGGIEKNGPATTIRTTTSPRCYDGVTPLGSADESHLYFRMRPPVGQPAWVEYQFKQPARSSHERCRTSPTTAASAGCLYPGACLPRGRRAGSRSRRAARIGVDKDRFNRVAVPSRHDDSGAHRDRAGRRHYKSGEIGPPDAMFLTREVAWREFGLIEWRVK